MMTTQQTLHKAEQLLQELKQLVVQAAQQEVRIDLTERRVFDGLMKIGLQLLQAFVAEAGDGDEGPTLVQGERRLRRLDEPHGRRYLSIFGELNIERRVYGTREGQKIEAVPLDARLALPAGEISYVLADWLERLCVQDAFGESVESLAALLGVQVSVDTAEHTSRQMSGQVASFRSEQWADPPPPEEEGELIVATADGKGVPMRRPPREPAAASPPPTTSRRGKGQKANKKQMAYVGAVYSIDRFVRTPDDIIDEVLRRQRAEERPVPRHKQVWAELTRAAPDDGEQTLDGRSLTFVELAVQAHRRNPDRQKPLVCLLDGETALWSQQAEWLSHAVGILDLFHVMERLWQVAHCFHAEGSKEASGFVERYLRMLLEGKVGYVIRSFKRLAREHNLRGQRLQRVTSAVGYFSNNRQHMRYDEYLAAGYPIGSGVAEGACRHLVKDRLERSGMRWTVSGAQAMLDLRSTYLNGDWNTFIEHHILQEQAALYTQAA